MTFFFDLTLADLTTRLDEWGEPRYRAKQVWQAAYHQLAASPAQITTLGKPLRQKLEQQLTFSRLTPETELSSTDGQTRKTLFRLPDGPAIEAVNMEYEKRRTACISTQAGCALGCVFCATGQMGFRRNLSAGEIVEQVIRLARAGDGAPLTNLVFMGMGEPFLNYDATLAAIDILNDADGFNFGARRMTLSTIGLVPMIERFAAEKRQVNLAVSLHAATDKLRSELLPINRKYPLPVLIPALRQYVEATHRRVTFEWALIQGKNDTPEQALSLVNLAEGLLCHVNIIPLNPTRSYTGAASTRERAAAFKAVLDECGIPCTIRVRRGVDIQAGCGQLAGQEAPQGLT